MGVCVAGVNVKDLLPGHSSMTKCKCQKCNFKVKALYRNLY